MPRKSVYGSSFERLPAKQLLALIIFCLLSANALAAPFSLTRYVKIAHDDHSAYVYNENFERLADNPYVPHTSIEFLPEDKALWYLGASIDVIRKNADGTIAVKSADPRYYEMNHHLVWLYHSEQKPVTSACGFNRPLAAGSELTDLRWPSGYAYKMQGGVFFPLTWHWENPGDVPMDEEVFLRFVIHLDDEGSDYRDTNVTWIDTVPCTSAFAVPPGEQEIEGPEYPVPVKARIVAVFPHMHDHGKEMSLKLNGEKLRKFKPDNAAIPVAHDDMGDGPVPFHVHPDHLPTDGLSAWLPGVHGPQVQPGDVLNTESEFNNPHAQTIDNMAINIVIWEALQ